MISLMITTAFIYLFYTITSIKNTNIKQKNISSLIQTNTQTYLKKQYKFVILIILIASFFVLPQHTRWTMSIIGGGCLALMTSYITTSLASCTNIKIAKLVEESASSAYKFCLIISSINSTIIHTMNLLFIMICHYFKIEHIWICAGFILSSYFIRISGGIYTKSADVGADLVGKMNLGLPEDSPSNAATIADATGDLVGDCQSAPLGLIESIMICLVYVYSTNFSQHIFGYISINFAVICGMISCLLQILTVHFFNFTHIINDTKMYLLMNAIGQIIMYIIGISYTHKSVAQSWWVFIGIITALSVSFITYMFTSDEYKYLNNTVESSSQGAAQNILQGFSYGHIGSMMVCFMICFILGSGYIIGSYIIGWNANYSLGYIILGIINISPVILTTDYIGSIFDTTGTIIEMTSKKYRDITDSLDYIGNSTKAITKGYSVLISLISNAIIMSQTYLLIKIRYSSLRMVISTQKYVSSTMMGILGSTIMISAFIGYTISQVSTTAGDVVSIVTKQIKQNPNILTGTELPNYAEVINQVSKKSLTYGVVSFAYFMVLFIPIIIENIFHIKICYIVYLTVLTSTISMGTLTGLYMIISGGLWDNTKKTIALNGDKKTDKYKSAVVGDLVGDPFKDTVGPSIFSFIKIISVLIFIIVERKY